MIALLLSLLLSSLSLAHEKQMEAIEKLFAIFDPVKKAQGKQVFSVDSCKIPQKQLLELALMRRPVKTSFKFTQGCDVDGVVELHVAKPFPVSLKVRNLDKYSYVKFTSILNVGSVGDGVGYKIDLQEGQLHGKSSSVLFSGVYNYILSLGEAKAAQADAGGELKITSIDGKAVSFTKLLGAGSPK